jgi:hypothetical protein
MYFSNFQTRFSQLQDKSILISKLTKKISTENHFLTTNDVIDPFFINIKLWFMIWTKQKNRIVKSELPLNKKFLVRLNVNPCFF